MLRPLRVLWQWWRHRASAGRERRQSAWRTLIHWVFWSSQSRHSKYKNYFIMMERKKQETSQSCVDFISTKKRGTRHTEWVWQCNTVIQVLKRVLWGTQPLKDSPTSSYPVTSRTATNLCFIGADRLGAGSPELTPLIALWVKKPTSSICLELFSLG